MTAFPKPIRVALREPHGAWSAQITLPAELWPAGPPLIVWNRAVYRNEGGHDIPPGCHAVYVRQFAYWVESP